MIDDLTIPCSEIKAGEKDTISTKAFNMDYGPVELQDS